MLLIVFSCPINRWNPNLFFPSWPLWVHFTLSSPNLFFFFFFFFTHMLLFGPPKFSSFVSSCSGTQQSSFIFHISPALSLTSRHESNFNLFRNHFPIDQAYYFYSVHYFPLTVMFLCLTSRSSMFPSHWIVKSSDQVLTALLTELTIAIHDLNILILF